MDFFTMTRRGSLHPEKSTPNQCKEEGHKEYFYELVIIFHGGSPLDKNAFIVEHSELDNAVKSVDCTGSCEQMHIRIRERLHAFFAEKKLNWYIQGFRCTIYPTLQSIQDGAFMSYTHVVPGSEGVMSLLR